MPIPLGMSVNDLVLVQGMHDTKLALRRWNEKPIVVLRPWFVLSTLISAGLLAAVYLVAELTPPDATHYVIPGVTQEAVRLSIIPQLLVTATPSPALMACTPLFTSSALPTVSSKVMVKSTSETGSVKSWRVKTGTIGTLCT